MPRGRPRISETILSDAPLSLDEALKAVEMSPPNQAPDSPTPDHGPPDAAPPANPQAPTPETAGGAGPTGPKIGLTTYQSRIRVLEAWQYPGQLSDAPAWVDRNWASWFDGGQLNGAEAGPALRIPSPTSPSGEKFCLRGDYVVRQEVTLAEGLTDDAQIEVWPKAEFERLFIPKNQRAADGTST